MKGDDFNEIAKRYSEGSTAKDGGDLGTFQRGQLSPQLEGVVFKMDKGQITDVIQTKTGFEVLKVENHYQAGLQPLDKVENEVMNKLYMEKMQPTLRTYLGELREESYVNGQARLHRFRRRSRRQRNSRSPAHSRRRHQKQSQEESALAQGRSMKSHFVSDLQDGQAVSTLFMVCEKGIRTSAARQILARAFAARPHRLDPRENVGQLRSHRQNLRVR